MSSHNPSLCQNGAARSCRTARAHRAWLGLILGAFLPLAGCAGEFTTQSEPLRLLAEQLPDAVLNEPYSYGIEAVGGLRPYEFALQSGALAPGLSLEGSAVRGTPTEPGTYEFTIAVSDANLSSVFEQFSLAVVTPPPPSLTLQPPDTESRGPVTLRARVESARSLAGLRTTVTWDPAAWRLVDDSVSATRQSMALFHHAERGSLQVDLALLGGTLTGAAQLFTFTLAPVDPPALIGVGLVTEFASRRSGELLFESQTLSEGRGDSRGTAAQDPAEDAQAPDPSETPDEPAAPELPPAPEEPSLPEVPPAAGDGSDG